MGTGTSNDRFKRSRRVVARRNEAADFLGDQPNEVALFALGHRPTAYRPLTEAEVSNLRAAVAGPLPASLSGSVRELLEDNSAATEFVMSEQLLTVANREREHSAACRIRILPGRRACSARPRGARFDPVPAVYSTGSSHSRARDRYQLLRVAPDR